MRLIPDAEFQALCRRIAAAERTVDDWRDRESDDEFSSEHYVGGYDATEDAFTFSYYDESGTEWWFQLPLPEVEAIGSGGVAPVACRQADAR